MLNAPISCQISDVKHQTSSMAKQSIFCSDLRALRLLVGEWVEGKRQGGGSCQFADGSLFHGEWQEDHWMQSEAEPSLCRVSGAGISSVTVGVDASFTIKVRLRDAACHLPPPHLESLKETSNHTLSLVVRVSTSAGIPQTFCLTEDVILAISGWVGGHSWHGRRKQEQPWGPLVVSPPAGALPFVPCDGTVRLSRRLQQK
jgi:hypothetical protein